MKQVAIDNVRTAQFVDVSCLDRKLYTISQTRNEVRVFCVSSSIKKFIELHKGIKLTVYPFYSQEIYFLAKQKAYGRRLS